MAEPVPNSNTLRRSTRTTTRFDYTGLFAKKNKNKLTLCRLTNKRKAHETSTESQPLPKRRRKGHTAYTPKAKNSNLSPQQIKRKQDRIRKQPRMKDGWYWNGEERVIQKMQTEDGKQKGMKQILAERGYNVKGMLKDDLQKLLAKEPDFVEDAEHNILVDAIKAKNEYAEVEYTPRYHCECNPKERHWCSGKRKYRDDQDFSNVKTAEQIIEQINESLDSVSIEEIKKYIKESILYCEAYRGGATTATVLETVKAMKSPQQSKRKTQRRRNVRKKN